MGAALSVYCTINTAIFTDEIVFSIADHCDTMSLLRLLTVCNATQRIIRRYIATVYDVNNIYIPFFGNLSRCSDFRSVLADTGALVSGFQAIQLLSRVRYPDSTLDVYVDCFQSEYIIRCLLRNGYRYVPSAAVSMRWSQLCGENASEYNGRSKLNLTNPRHHPLLQRTTQAHPTRNYQDKPIGNNIEF